MPVSRDEFNQAPIPFPKADWERDLKEQIIQAMLRAVETQAHHWAEASRIDAVTFLSIADATTAEVCQWIRNRGLRTYLQ